jgi:hypothetical protein
MATELPHDFVRELSELVGKYFVAISTPDTNTELSTATVVGKCPRCKSDVVRRNRKNGGSYIECSKREFQDLATCQFSAWEPDQIEDFLAGKTIKFKKRNPDKKPSPPSATAHAAPNKEVQDIFGVIDSLNKLPQGVRTRILTELGWDGGSYVMWLNKADPAVVALVAKALDEEPV